MTYLAVVKPLSLFLVLLVAGLLLGPAAIRGQQLDTVYDDNGDIILVVPADTEVEEEDYYYENDEYYEEEDDSVYVYQPPPDLAVLNPLPEETHRELLEELDYSGEPTPEPEPEEVKPRNNDWLKDLFDFEPLRLGPFATSLVMIMLLIGLGFFIYRFLDIPALRRKPKASEAAGVSIEEVEEDKLTLSETESLLERAVRHEQYGLAVRLHYLALLKRLDEMKMIHFSRDKINLHYLREMDRQPDLGPGFRRITRNFERNWYGRYPLDRLTYRLIADTYADFNQRLDGYRLKAKD